MLESIDFGASFAVQLALLHDTLEDTPTTYDDLSFSFSKRVADGVLALSKDKTIPKENQLNDSIQRILLQPKEVCSVKLADRITNLLPQTPHWSKGKIATYHSQAKFILESLKGCNQYLENRLASKIIEYQSHF